MNVCACMNVKVDDVKNYINENSDCSIEALKGDLKIGAACGCCNKTSCPKIDSHFEDVYISVKNA
jgi:bacterioferritin-associated ferredoxin